MNSQNNIPKHVPSSAEKTNNTEIADSLSFQISTIHETLEQFRSMTFGNNQGDRDLSPLLTEEKLREVEGLARKIANQKLGEVESIKDVSGFISLMGVLAGIVVGCTFIDYGSVNKKIRINPDTGKSEEVLEQKNGGDVFHESIAKAISGGIAGAIVGSATGNAYEEDKKKKRAKIREGLVATAVAKLYTDYEIALRQFGKDHPVTIDAANKIIGTTFQSILPSTSESNPSDSSS